MQKSGVICSPVLGSHSPGHIFSSQSTGQNSMKIKKDEIINRYLLYWPFYIKLPEKYLLPELHVSGILHPLWWSIFPGHIMSFSPHWIGQWLIHPLPSFMGMQVSGVDCSPVFGSQNPGQDISFPQSQSTGQNSIKTKQ